MHLPIYLKLNKIGHKEFGSMIGVSTATVSNYIRANRLPPLDIGRKIEKVTREVVTIDDLLEYWEEKRNEKLDKRAR